MKYLLITLLLACSLTTFSQPPSKIAKASLTGENYYPLNFSLEETQLSIFSSIDGRLLYRGSNKSTVVCEGLELRIVSKEKTLVTLCFESNEYLQIFMTYWRYYASLS